MITLKNVCVDFPIYNASGRSLKNQLMRVATGGQIGTNTEGRVIVRALNDISFNLNSGDRVGILGHNGAGKSTLLRVLGKVYEPTSGEISIKGKIGSLLDISLGIDPEATGRENIYIRSGLLGITRKQVQHKINEIINFSELGDFIDMPLRTYSTGMHMRLAFSIATIVRPDILIMDEWLSVGDENFKQKVEARMSELVKAASILIIASHSKELILDTCNRVLWLEHGRLKMDGDPQEIVELYFK